MKKLVAVLVVIVCLFVTVGHAVESSTSYLRDSFSTLEYAREIRQRIFDLAAKDTYSEVDAELCMQYSDLHIRLIEISLIELDVFVYGELQQTGRFDEVIKLISQMRSMHEMGILTNDVLIETLAQAAETAAQGVEEVFSGVN